MESGAKSKAEGEKQHPAHFSLHRPGQLSERLEQAKVKFVF